MKVLSINSIHGKKDWAEVPVEYMDTLHIVLCKVKSTIKDNVVRLQGRFPNGKRTLKVETTMVSKSIVVR